jgi:hypothetical protein
MTHFFWRAGALFRLALLLALFVWLVGCAAEPAPVTGGSPFAAGGDYGRVDFAVEDFDGAMAIYSPALRPERFVACVDHPYYPLIPGTVYRLEEETDEGLETITITVTNERRDIGGIQATVVRDTVLLEGELIEDTFDWFAQDDRGNVWYLGEATQEYEGGQAVSSAGSWESGVGGAVAGIYMPAQPRPGDVYFQEYFPGEAEDMGAVVSLSERVTTALGSFTDVWQTADYNPLGGQLEHKWYAPGIGLIQEQVVDGATMVELVSISQDNSQLDPDRPCGQSGGVSAVPANDGRE